MKRERLLQESIIGDSRNEYQNLGGILELHYHEGDKFFDGSISVRLKNWDERNAYWFKGNEDFFNISKEQRNQIEGFNALIYRLNNKLEKGWRERNLDFCDMVGDIEEFGMDYNLPTHVETSVRMRKIYAKLFG